jgi:hypothetical protein
MSPFLADLFSLSICIAGILAILRFKKINKIYWSFLYLVWICCIYEIVESIMLSTGVASKLHIYNAIDNVYNLLHFLLVLSFLKKFADFKKANLTYGLIAIVLSLVWIIEIFISKQIYGTYIYFSIISCFIIVLLSINTINTLIASISKNLLTSPVFIICAALIIKFTYTALVSVFWLYGLGQSRQLLVSVMSIIFYIAFIANLLYAIAILMMPKKEPYYALKL